MKNNQIACHQHAERQARATDEGKIRAARHASVTCITTLAAAQAAARRARRCAMGIDGETVAGLVQC